MVIFMLVNSKMVFFKEMECWKIIKRKIGWVDFSKMAI